MEQNKVLPIQGLILKLILSPTVIFLSGIIFREVFFSTIHPPLFMGLVYAAVAHTIEVHMLKPGNVWISTFMDFAAAFVIIYLLAFILPDTIINLFGALYTAFLLSLTEYGQHLWLLWYQKINQA